MKKLRIEELEITSFETVRKDEGETAAAGLSGFTCPRCPTVPTRDGTCCTP